MYPLSLVSLISSVAEKKLNRAVVVVIQIAEATGMDQPRQLPRRSQGGGSAKVTQLQELGPSLCCSTTKRISDCLGAKRHGREKKRVRGASELMREVLVFFTWLC